VLKGFGDEPIERLGAVARQLPPQGAVYLANIGGAIDHQCAVVLRVNIWAAQHVLIAELSDDLFEDVFERDDAAYVAVFVDHDADPPLLLLEVQQLGGKRSIFRHEIGFVTGFEQAFLGQLVMAEQASNLSHVDDALDLVDVVAEHRQTRVWRGAQLADDRFQIVIEIDPGDLVTRDHDVVDGDPLQIENAEQHALPIQRQVGAGFAYDAA